MSMHGADIDIVDDHIVFHEFGRLRKMTYRHRLHRGGWSGTLTREVFERPNAAAVLPYDPLRDCVLLIEQFRVGAYAAGLNPWQLEPLAGHVQANESVVDVARRESLEEGGCVIGEMVAIGKYLVSPGYATETVHVFCGRMAASVEGGLFGIDEEDIRAQIVPFDTAMTDLAGGRFENALTLISLQWLALHHDEVRRKWMVTT